MKNLRNRVRLSLGEGKNSGKNTWMAKVIDLLIIFSIFSNPCDRASDLWASS